MAEVNFLVKKGLTVPKGSAVTPAVIFDASDPNTGIYSPGADQLALSTNGTGRLFVDANGNVGISTNAPVGGGSVNVSINGSAASEANLLVNNTKTALFYADSSSVIAGSVTSIPYVFRTANTERARIDSSGRLGIGTSSPSALTHLSNTSTTAGYNFLQITAGGESQVHTVKSTVSTGRDLEVNSARTLKLTTGSNTGSFPSEGHFQFSHGTNGDLVRIAADGKVGIGTTSPDDTLHLVGSTGYGLKNTDGTHTVVLRTVSGGGILKTASNHALVFGTNDTERARIDSSGRLLVGTSSDSGGALLQVNDNRIRIATAKTPASAADTGTAGEICWDANYIYVCTASNTWKRAALFTW